MPTYHIITIGCQMNISDSERLASRLEQAGFKKTDNKYGADLVIINTCGVRQSAENRIYGLIPGIKKENRKAKIILTGCLSERKDVRRRLKKYVDAWLPVKEILNFKFKILNYQRRGNDNFGNQDYLSIQPKHDSNFSAYVPIGNGCDNFCVYCVVPYARGREVYRSAQEILAEVRGLVKRGYKEVVLIAQNVNSYKSPIPPSPPLSRGGDFADLLKTINDIPGDFWIRFLSSHPKDMSDKLIKAVASCEKACPQIYLPVQAGDNLVLKRMNRQYTRADYIKLVKKIRKQLNLPSSPFIKGVIWKPPVSITTDIIVGFPSETRKQFNNSVKLFRQVGFDMAYISEYSPRPGTAAFKLVYNVSPAEKTRRKNQLDKILRQTALANNKKYIGKTVRVLMENQTKVGKWFGKTATGKDIRFSAKSSICRAGNFVKVKVTGAKEFCLAGKV